MGKGKFLTIFFGGGLAGALVACGVVLKMGLPDWLAEDILVPLGVILGDCLAFVGVVLFDAWRDG